MAKLVLLIFAPLAVALDRLVAEGVVPSRSAAVRLGLEGLNERHRRQRIGRSIVEGYARRPQTEADVAWADAATVRMIADEPW